MPTIKQSKVTPDAKKAKAAVKALSRREKEEQRRRAQRTAYLKRYGVLAALGIAAMLAVVLLIAKWNKPADTDDVRPKDTVASDKDTAVADMKPRSAGVEPKVKPGKKGVQRYTLPQEELINSLPKFADITDEQFVYPKQPPSVADPDFFKPVMVMTTSGADKSEDEKQVVNMAIQWGFIAVRVENTKYALYAPDNHPSYKNPPAK
jgi:hypothetical protein